MKLRISNQMPAFKIITMVLAGLVFGGCEAGDNLSPDTVISESESTDYLTKRIIIVAIDGPRFSETWGDPSKQYIPNLAQRLGLHGVHYNWFYNNGPTYTSSGHTALTTGRYQVMKNDGSKFPKSPSIFQLYLNQTGKNPTKAQIITSKAKLEVLGDCTDKEWRGKFNPLVDAQDREDSVTFRIALTSMSNSQPDLLLIHFKGPDTNGHANNWNGYINSIKETDQYLWDLWEYIQTNEYYQNTTTLLVTNDHGRHLDHFRDGFVSHEDNCEGCLHIILFAIGPDFKTGLIYEIPRDLPDLAPTIGALLGFTIPNKQGAVLTELFKNN